MFFFMQLLIVVFSSHVHESSQSDVNDGFFLHIVCFGLRSYTMDGAMAYLAYVNNLKHLLTTSREMICTCVCIVVITYEFTIF